MRVNLDSSLRLNANSVKCEKYHLEALGSFGLYTKCGSRRSRGESSLRTSGARVGRRGYDRRRDTLRRPNEPRVPARHLCQWKTGRSSGFLFLTLAGQNLSSFVLGFLHRTRYRLDPSRPASDAGRGRASRWSVGG